MQKGKAPRTKKPETTNATSHASQEEVDVTVSLGGNGLANRSPGLAASHFTMALGAAHGAGNQAVQQLAQQAADRVAGNGAGADPSGTKGVAVQRGPTKLSTPGLVSRTGGGTLNAAEVTAGEAAIRARTEAERTARHRQEEDRRRAANTPLPGEVIMLFNETVLTAQQSARQQQSFRLPERGTVPNFDGPRQEVNPTGGAAATRNAAAVGSQGWLAGEHRSVAYDATPEDLQAMFRTLDQPVQDAFKSTITMKSSRSQTARQLGMLLGF